MNIHILWSTIRPQVFLEMHKKWIDKSKYPDNIKTYVAVNWQEHADVLKGYLKKNYVFK